MKTLLTFLLAGLSFGVLAQRSVMHKEVDDNGKRLRIRVDMEQGDKSLHFKQDYDVRGMTPEQKARIEAFVMDSLGLSNQSKAQVYVQGRAEGWGQAARNYEKVARQSDGWGSNQSAIRTNGATSQGWGEARPTYASAKPEMEQVMGRIPYSKMIKEDKENKRLWMHFEYKLDGEDKVFERTINLEGKTEREKKRLIEETERSLGLSVAQ
ncbi:hypothetical protein [Tellurirhabdus bombi]|uniref:hypothetical protein n=1 Tax=Tellurirhabdus bombi TaxID=2907205 RepID=UPI001F1CD73E|nr:hypothetical protein [Tellurirhabdus bombi]